MYCPLMLKLQVKIYKFFTRAHFMLRSSVPSMICRRWVQDILERKTAVPLALIPTK